MNSRLVRLMFLALVAAMLYSINRFLMIPQWQDVAFLKDYLGDALALPVYIPLSFYIALRLHLISNDFNLRLTHIIGAVLIFSLVFEGIIPVIDSHSVRDPVDILAYLGGGLLVYCVSAIGTVKSIDIKNEESVR